MDVLFESGSWTWGTAARTETEYAGRRCTRFDGGELGSLETVAGVELREGAIEVEVAVAPGRAFPGVVWRLQDDENFESFFVRPHQTGNDDAIQYTPVFNGSSAWQLYHGPGFWSPVAFPLDGWFTIRVVFAGDVAEIFVLGLEEPTLVVRQRREAASGRVGLMVSGDRLHVARFSVDPEARPSSDSPPAEPSEDDAIPAWSVSDPFPEGSSPDPAELGWTRLDSEPSGLTNLARAHAIRDGRNTVYARSVVRAERAGSWELAFGFSDRAVFSLNGRPLYRGDYTYRSRDYRFLGGIGYWDTLVLPLEAGDNELLVAVSEDFGGWGVQARFAETDGLTLR
jgi:hypothetical protein